MEVSLVLVGKNGSQREIPLRKSRIVIGRQTDCQVRIPLASVSRQHCEIRMDGGRAVLRDLKSRNGSYVNRKRVENIDLSAGDLVNIGPFVFVVRVGGSPKQIDSRRVLETGSMPADSGDYAEGGTKTSPGSPTRAKSGDPRAGTAADEPDGSSIVEFDFTDDDDAPKL